MKKNLYMAVLTLCLMALFAACGGHRADDALYDTLDSLLDEQPRITNDKEQRLVIISHGLQRPGLSDIERYDVNQHLYDEYMAFRFDSALHYSASNIALARQMGDRDREYFSMTQLAHILSVTGLFDAASELLDSIDTNQLSDLNRVAYDNARMEVSLYQTEQAATTPYQKTFYNEMMACRDRLMANENADEYTRTFNRATYTNDKGQTDQAISILEGYLPRERDNRQYSILTSTLAFFYKVKGDSVKQEEYLLRSAINDVRCAIRENNALRELAILLFDRGDTQRAFRYITTSAEDATFYGTRLRNSQVAQVAPKITEAYGNARKRILNGTILFLVIAAILALAAFFAFVQRARLLKKLHHEHEATVKANERLSIATESLRKLNEQMTETNKELKELGLIKEEFIGRFFELGSAFVTNSAAHKRQLNKLAREHKMEALYKELRSTTYEDQLKESFFQRFDDAFLSICPGFVEAVNELLEPQNRIQLQGERMTTELRILALIRLDISNNQKIADILHSSITTVYTYRSKLRAKAKNRDTFEDDVWAIGR